MDWARVPLTDGDQIEAEEDVADCSKSGRCGEDEAADDAGSLFSDNMTKRNLQK